MGKPVMWFEVLGKDRAGLLRFYEQLFEWKSTDVDGVPYSMIDTGAGQGINGGIGEPPPGGQSHVTVYVSVDDVGAALEQASALGGDTVMGPMEMPDGTIVGLFTDPEGHVIGVVKGG
jgi:uncharacterized protein